MCRQSCARADGLASTSFPKRLREGVALLLALPLALALACSGTIEEQLEEIRSLQDRGAFEESIEPLREVLAESPDHPEANFLLGTALTQTGELGNAVFSLTRAAEDPEFGAQAGMLLATNLLHTNNLEKAVEAAERVTRLEPDLFAGWMLLAGTQLQKRDFEDMLASVDRALEIEPGHLQARGLRASALLEFGRYDEADELLEQLEEETANAGDTNSAATACTARAGSRMRRAQPETVPDDKEVLARAMAGATDPAARARRKVEGPEDEVAVASEEAEALYKACFDRYPGFEMPVKALADYYDQIGQPEKATAVWARATEASPEVMAFRIGRAQHLWDQGDRERAKELLVVATDDFQTPQAYEALAELYRLDKEFDKAAAAIAAAGELGGSSDRLRFQRAEMLASAGEVEQAETLLAEIEEETYRDLVRGRIALVREQYAEALDHYEKALLRWPDNGGARALAALAAYRLGDFDRALAEYREAVRTNPEGGGEATLAAAQLAHALGRHGEALTYVKLHLKGGTPEGPEAHLVGARAATALGQAELADEFLKDLALLPGMGGHALAETARLLNKRTGPDGVVALLHSVALDWTAEENLPALRELVQAHIDQGTATEVLDEVDSAIAARGETADLLDLRGRALVAADRDAEARAAFEKAIALDPESGNPHEGLGVLAQRSQDTAEALRQLDLAVELNPEAQDAAYRAAQIVLANGDVEGAIQRLRQVVARYPAVPKARNDLAFLLAQRGEDLDTALSLAKQAVRLEPGPSVADTLAFVQLKRGEWQDAIQTLESALARTPEVPTLRYRLGEALAAKGDIDAAQSAIKQALGIGPFPEAEEARAMLVRLGSGTGSATN